MMPGHDEEKPKLAPRSFAECVDYMDLTAGLNATIRALGIKRAMNSAMDIPGPVSEEFAAYAAASASAGSQESSAVRMIGDYLSETFGARQFIPMVTSSKQAMIAAVFYAGDGIVMKVTEGSYLPAEHRPIPGAFTIMPGVLFPMHSTDIGGFKVEVFPWVDRKNVMEKDVEEMSRILKKSNLRFTAKDARTDNIGRLPNGRLVVLDGNAVELIDPHKPIPTQDINRWTREVQMCFDPLYTAAQVEDREAPILRPESERGSDFFEERFSPLIGRHPEKKTHTDQASRRGWWFSR